MPVSRKNNTASSSDEVVDFNELIKKSSPKTAKNEEQNAVEEQKISEAPMAEEKIETANSIPSTQLLSQTQPAAPVRPAYSNVNGVTNDTNERVEYRSLENNSRYQQEDNTYKVDGVLEIKGEYGILRQKQDPTTTDLPKDVYVALTQINKFGLRKADRIEGIARAPKDTERYLSLLRVDKVEGIDSREARNRPRFEKLTPIFPNQRIRLETKPEVLSTRLIDLLSPIGKGQRGMIVAPPKAGKTWLLTDIAGGIAENHPEIEIMVVLIGERPEEVTHIQREVKGGVWSSNFDESAEQQVSIAEIALEKAKRIAEKGGDVVILMDSITRLARAYNMVEAPSGRTLTGGFDPAALYPPKRFFGAARKFEEGGSLTIMATALVDTGSRMDDVIYEEFKGTGNMELFLDRELQERRIFPAFDVKRSMTRHDELLYTKLEQEKIITLRRMVDFLDEKEATAVVLERIKKTKTNEEFLNGLSGGKI